MRIKFLHTVLESLTPGSYPEYVNRIFSISLYIAVEKVPPDLFVCFSVFSLLPYIHDPRSIWCMCNLSERKTFVGYFHDALTPEICKCMRPSSYGLSYLMMIKWFSKLVLRSITHKVGPTFWEDEWYQGFNCSCYLAYAIIHLPFNTPEKPRLILFLNIGKRLEPMHELCI